MRFVPATGLLLAGAVLAAATYTVLPWSGADHESPAGSATEELEALRVRLASIENAQAATLLRLSELEDALHADDRAYQGENTGLALLEETGDEEAEPVHTPRKPGAPDRERIEEAGLSAEEFDAMEDRAYALYLDSLESEWARRREIYMSRDREPGPTEQLREELGDSGYDRYLYASGRPNRVRLHQVLPGSTAEQAGLARGDIVLSYGGERVFSFEDLRRSTYQGEPGDSVIVEVRRSDGGIAQLLMQRGPLGLSGYRGWREAPDQ
jgi:membrane-associated protease RseP (regulator of RpoE activity)